MTGKASVRVDVRSDDGASVACTMHAKAGTVLVDACDAYRAPVEFSCRAACCSSCRVRVLDGQQHLAAPDAMEQELITASGGEADVRYCCAAKLADDAPIGAHVVLQPLGPAF
jgi:ferredoxin